MSCILSSLLFVFLSLPRLKTFQAIQEQMIAHGAEPVNFDDVKDEIFDMIRPEHPSRITLQDLVRSGQGHTAVSILLELHGFWAYENREALAAAGDHS